jgi:CRISPR/Cas system CSM-associated protein Csm2 small subunit
MIQTDSNKETLKQIKERERKEQEQQLRQKCEAFAFAKYGEDQVKQWSNKYKGLWYLPALDENGEIEKLVIMKPIDRHILSHASTKIEDEGLYLFLEACMRECLVDGDNEILDDDEYFIPAAMKFNKIMESKKVAFLKR